MRDEYGFYMYKTPFRQVYSYTFLGMLHSTWYCHVWLRFLTLLPRKWTGMPDFSKGPGGAYPAK